MPRANKGPSMPANIAPTDPITPYGHSGLFSFKNLLIEGVLFDSIESNSVILLSLITTDFELPLSSLLT